MLRKFLSVAILIGLAPSVMAQQRTAQGVAVGGATGAIIGGIIGHQNRETPEGALIGGAVGAIAGGLIGKSQDNRIAQQRAYEQQAYQQQYYHQQQAIVASGVSPADVVAMTRSGVSEPLIMSHLQSKGVQRRLEVSEIISLHQQGVSDNVIQIMQSAPLATQVNSRVYAPAPVYAPQPVIVREQPVIYSSPVVVESYYRPAPVHYHHYHHRPSNSIRVGF